MEDVVTVTVEPIVIVGAGATGCTLALLLARRGAPTMVIERRELAWRTTDRAAEGRHLLDRFLQRTWCPFWQTDGGW